MGTTNSSTCREVTIEAGPAMGSSTSHSRALLLLNGTDRAGVLAVPENQVARRQVEPMYRSALEEAGRGG
jgi:hypothetical protein